MSVHLSYIAGVVTRSYESILAELNTSNGKFISNNAYSLGNHITSVIEETSVIHGQELVIHRVFVHSADSGGYETVGWVLSGDVKYCMICSNTFGYFTYQHYCNACGNVVCQKCSSNVALIFEIEQLGPKRVCDQCYWGQEMVYCLHRSTASTPAQTPLKVPPMVTPSKKTSFNTPIAPYYPGSAEQVKDLHHRIDKIHTTLASSAKKEYTNFAGYASAVTSPGDIKSDYDSDDHNEYLNHSIDAYTTRLQHSEDTYHQYLTTTAGAVYSPNMSASFNNHNDLSYSAIPESRSRSRSNSSDSMVASARVKHAPVLHLEFMEALVQKPRDVVENEYKLYTVIDRAVHQDEPYIENMLLEEISVNSNPTFIRRVFAHCIDSGSYAGVGWQLLCDVTHCMICSQHFNAFVYPRHCHACGNVVCGSCSPDEAIVHEMQSLGMKRVCVQCYWGQEIVFGQYRKPTDKHNPRQEPEHRLSEGIAYLRQGTDDEANDPNSLENILKELSVKDVSEPSGADNVANDNGNGSSSNLLVKSNSATLTKQASTSSAVSSNTSETVPPLVKNQSSASRYNNHFHDETTHNQGGAVISNESIGVKNAIQKFKSLEVHSGNASGSNTGNAAGNAKVTFKTSPMASSSSSGASGNTPLSPTSSTSYSPPPPMSYSPPVTPVNRRSGSPVPRPPQMLGWLKKRGHVVLNWKSRYFVLDNGYLTYYVDKLDTPPFGKELKGQLCLAGYRDAEVVGTNHNWDDTPATVTTASGKKRVLQRKVSFSATSAGNGSGSNWNKQVIETPAGESSEYDLRKLCTIHLASNTSGMVYTGTADEGVTTTQSISLEPSRNSEVGHELFLEASTVEEKVQWLAALNAHILYIEDVLQTENAANILLSSGTMTGSSGVVSDDMEERSDFPAKAVVPSGKVTNAVNNYQGGGTGNFYKKQLSTVDEAPERGLERTKSGRRSVVLTRRLQIFLKDDETLLFSGIVTKPNPMGVQLMRELLWTSGRRLIYIDPKTLEVKGEVKWLTTESQPKVKLIDNTSFEITDCRKKVYRFVSKDEISAQDWVTAIESVL